MQRVGIAYDMVLVSGMFRVVPVSRHISLLLQSTQLTLTGFSAQLPNFPNWWSVTVWTTNKPDILRHALRSGQTVTAVVPRPTQPSINPGSANEDQRLGWQTGTGRTWLGMFTTTSYIRFNALATRLLLDTLTAICKQYRMIQLVRQRTSDAFALLYCLFHAVCYVKRFLPFYIGYWVIVSVTSWPYKTIYSPSSRMFDCASSHSTVCVYFLDVWISNN